MPAFHNCSTIMKFSFSFFIIIIDHYGMIFNALEGKLNADDVCTDFCKAFNRHDHDVIVIKRTLDGYSAF